LTKGYEVLGLSHSPEDLATVHAFVDNPHFTQLAGDLTDFSTFQSSLDAFAPDEVYNIAAVSDLKTAIEKPEYTQKVNYRAFEDIVAHTTLKNSEVRIFQALSSRILIPDSAGVITESSHLSEPKNPYDVAKRDSYEKVVLPYRKKGFFVASGFLCNHESPRRGSRFVTGKIAASIARMYRSADEKLIIGNLDARRDWSFAGDVVSGMSHIMQAPQPSDYVVGSGELHTVQEFIDVGASIIDLKLEWIDEGISKKAYDESGILRVEVNPEYYQPDDNPVVSKTHKLETETGWKRTTSFSELVRMMVEAELKKL
jgi:GDPmannose 4,6-dehydratase